jgi:hypothetical protein
MLNVFLLGNRQQPLGEQGGIGAAADARIGNDRDRLPDEDGESELLADVGQRRPGHVRRSQPSTAPFHGRSQPALCLTAVARC